MRIQRFITPHGASSILTSRSKNKILGETISDELMITPYPHLNLGENVPLSKWLSTRCSSFLRGILLPLKTLAPIT